MANKVIARIPLDYNDFGSYALTEKGTETFDSIINSMLPEDAYWCGDEVIADESFCEEIDIRAIISEAADRIMEMDAADGEQIWES